MKRIVVFLFPLFIVTVIISLFVRSENKSLANEYYSWKMNNYENKIMSINSSKFTYSEAQNAIFKQRLRKGDLPISIDFTFENNNSCIVDEIEGLIFKIDKGNIEIDFKASDLKYNIDNSSLIVRGTVNYNLSNLLPTYSEEQIIEILKAFSDNQLKYSLKPIYVSKSLETSKWIDL